MPIADFFIVRILNYIRRETEHDEDEIDMMRYSLQAILWEIEKTIYLLIIFIVLGFGWEILAAMVSVMTIRPTAGGFHSSTVWGCFFWTLLGFSLALLVLPNIPLVNVTVVAVGLFSLVTTYIATPTRSKQMRAIADTSKDGQKKIKATAITLLWFVVLFFNQGNFLAPAVLWIIFLQNLQLLIEFLKQKHEASILEGVS